jgi:hypothetical protein
MNDCPNCEYHNQRAQRWREEAYKQSGHLLPEREPVAWIKPKELLVMRGNAYAGAKDWRVNLGLEPEKGDVGLYIAPPQRTWVGLTDEELDALYRAVKVRLMGTYDTKDIYRAIEAKLKEKNHG